MKTVFLLLIGASFSAATAAQIQVQPALRNTQVQPVSSETLSGANLPGMRDTLKMLMEKVMELEKQQLSGGKKSIRTIIPNAGNMCFPYKDSRWPSQSFFQGVMVDDAVCNNNPNAVLIVTVKTQQPAQPVAASVSYDAADGRWKISLQGYKVAGIAKNVQCYNFNGKDQTACPSSGLYQNVGLMEPVTLSPDYSNGIELNVLITERPGNPLPKIKMKN